MNTAPSGNDIKNIVTIASRTPTGDNCQPFRFNWDGKKLAVSHLTDKARHHFNYHNVGSIIALGMLLETIAIAAGNHHLETAVTLNLSDTLDDPACAEIEFIPNPKLQPVDLLDAIDLRNTDRRAYKGGSIHSPLFTDLLQTATSYQNSNLYFNDRYSKEILDYICTFETYTWKTPDAHKDVFEWIRYSKEETVATQDGMPWQSLGVSYFESRFLKLMTNYKVQSVFNKLGGLSQIKNLAKKMIKSSAGLGCITSASLRSEDLADAGRLAMRTWLSLAKNGYGLQPYALTSLVVYSYLIDPTTDHFNPEFKPTFDKGKDVLQNFFNIPADEYPCWVFRTGLTSPLPNAMRTLRLPLETIWQES